MKPGTFQKGSDPRRNVKGRPSRKSMTMHLDEVLTDHARKKIATRLKDAAKRGDLQAIQFVYDRLEGRAKQAVEHTGEGGGPVEFTIHMDASGDDGDA